MTRSQRHKKDIQGYNSGHWGTTHAPTAVVLSPLTVPSNQPINTVVGVLSAVDLSYVDSWTYAFTSNPSTKFNILGSQVRMQVNNLALGTYPVSIMVTDGEGLTFTQDLTITCAPSAPSDIALSAATIAHTASVHDVIGALTSTDVDTGDTFTYTITGGADAASFEISVANLRVGASLTAGTKVVQITSTDSHSLAFAKTFNITVT